MALKSIFEALESRTLLATITVDTLSDIVDAGDGMTSLREAVDEANADTTTDTINFDPSLAGGTIYVTQGEISVTEGLNITGLGSDTLTVDAQGLSRIFMVSTTGQFGLSGLTLTAGSSAAAGGGAVMAMARNVSISDVVASNNAAFGDGGAFYLDTTLGVQISNSTFQLNNTETGGDGGAVFVMAGGGVTYSNVTATSNQADGDGGAFYNDAGGAVSLSNATLYDNRADGDGGAFYASNSLGDIVLNNATAMRNYSSSSGGAAYIDSSSGDARITGGSFEDNLSDSYAAAVYVDDAVWARHGRRWST